MNLSNSSEMNSALERLRTERIHHKQTSEYQIKVGPYNFYPGKGTICYSACNFDPLSRGIGVQN